MPTKTNSPLHIAPALIGMGVKGLVGGFGEVLRDRKEAKDAGEKYSFKEGLGDFGRGAATGITGMDFTDQREAEEQPTYRTNIDPMTGEEIPLMMTGNMKPLKMLTGIKGNIPHNMSAKQHNDALKMQEISGASSLMFTEEGLNKLPNDIPGKFGDIVRKEKTEQKK
ncbi:hypothetical protein OAV25_01295 [Flavobacteriaceae bacterium]|nr:hypothetical protein [Flavobacteriaceae bacterium]